MIMFLYGDGCREVILSVKKKSSFEEAKNWVFYIKV